MFLKKVVVYGLLFQCNFVYSIDPKTTFLIYNTRILNCENYSQMTRFCSVGKEYWALQCTKVFDFLRNDLNYKDWYPDYKSFSNEAASTKCALTDIMFLDGSETLFEGQQILAGCYGRRAVVPYNIAVEDDRLYNSIKIHYSKVGLMIFEYNETVRKYVALHWFPCSSYNKNIPDELYAQEPPRGIFDVQEVHQILLGYYITNKLQVQLEENIVNMADEKMSLSLCLLALKNSRHNDFETSPLFYDGCTITLRQYETIIIEPNLQGICGPFTYNMAIHTCRGRRITEQGIREFNMNMYALTQGPDNNSMIVLRETRDVDNNLMFMPVELISQVYPEFVNMIDTEYLQ